jgi:hypothetical protein
MHRLNSGLVLILILLLVGCEAASQGLYPWLDHYDESETIAARFETPPGYLRDSLPPGSFGHWLRHLPLKPGKPPVMLHDGSRKGNQDAHVAVLDIDTGMRNLQQCADAVIRLRAEYLYSQARYDEIHFDFTSGDKAAFRRWIEGYRPVVNGNNVSWTKSAGRDSSYHVFRDYLNSVFTYAGSYSLSLELVEVDIVTDIETGDVFILGSFPGHAVIVLDVAANPASGEKVFLLAQSYMPAQDIHLLKNPVDPDLSPWYRTDFGNTLRTPEWIFRPSHLKRWEDQAP